MKFLLSILLIGLVMNVLGATTEVHDKNNRPSRQNLELKGTSNNPVFIKGEVITKEDHEQIISNAEERRLKAALDEKWFCRIKAKSLVVAL